MVQRNKAVFLDRDGVLNRAIIRSGRPYPPVSVDELDIFPDAADALSELKRGGFMLFGVTNQPDVARGKTLQNAVEQINSTLKNFLPLDDIYVCYHDDHDECLCRKPNPGMLNSAAEKYHLDLQQSWMIGDRWRDIEAGRRAECRTIWIKNEYAEKKPEKYDFAATTLSEAVYWIKANSMES